MLYTYKRLLPIIGIVALVVAVLVLAVSNQSDNPAPFGNGNISSQAAEFKRYTQTLKQASLPLVYESSGPLCTKDTGDCTLSALYVYTPTSDYRVAGKQILGHLQAKGYDFPKDSKYRERTITKLNDTTIADNLRDSEPIVVSLENPKIGTRIMLYIGDKGRTLPSVKGIQQLPKDQLVIGLQFMYP